MAGYRRLQSGHWVGTTQCRQLIVMCAKLMIHSIVTAFLISIMRPSKSITISFTELNLTGENILRNLSWMSAWCWLLTKQYYSIWPPGGYTWNREAAVDETWNQTFIARVSRLRNPACILLWRTELTVSCREYKKPIVTRQSHTENGYLTNKSNMWSQSGKSSRACLHKSVAISM